MSSFNTSFGCANASKCIRDASHSHCIMSAYQRKLFSTTTLQHRSKFDAFAHPPKKRRISWIPTTQESSRRMDFSTSPLSCDPASTSSHVPWPTHANPTPYDIFNLPRSATQKEIKSRYFLLVKQYHPDHVSYSSVEKFRKVVEAYKILSHPAKRHEYDCDHPETSSQPQHSEYRRPWSGSRISRRHAEPKGSPPGGGWSFHRSGKRSHLRTDFSHVNTASDNAHFNYEAHYRRNLELEMKIKKRMDELHAHRVEFERERERNNQTARLGLAFTGGLFVCIFLAAKAMAT